MEYYNGIDLYIVEYIRKIKISLYYERGLNEKYKIYYILNVLKKLIQVYKKYFEWVLNMQKKIVIFISYVGNMY